MKAKVIFRDLGECEYSKAWDFQRKLMAEIQEIKKINSGLPACEQTNKYNYLLFCEHPHVFTIGKSGSDNNLLVNENFLRQKGASLFRIDRGGDITYHGPGQVVGYPIFDLETFGMGVRQYIAGLEQVIINALAFYRISAGRLEGATGVWLDAGDPHKVRKICAIGVKVSRSVTMHGFAFNVNTNLEYYNLINPCGFTDKGVTSMEKELGKTLDMEEIKGVIAQEFTNVFGFEFEEVG